MKAAKSLLVIAFVLLMFVGVAVAKDMSGKVEAVDAAKGTLTLTSGKLKVPFDCETGSLVKDIKVGQEVTVTYREEKGKKIATKVMPKKATSGY